MLFCEPLAVRANVYDLDKAGRIGEVLRIVQKRIAILIGHAAPTARQRFAYAALANQDIITIYAGQSRDDVH